MKDEDPEEAFKKLSLKEKILYAPLLIFAVLILPQLGIRVIDLVVRTIEQLFRLR
jgi:hypothetical protein